MHDLNRHRDFAGVGSVSEALAGGERRADSRHAHNIRSSIRIQFFMLFRVESGCRESYRPGRRASRRTAGRRGVGQQLQPSIGHAGPIDAIVLKMPARWLKLHLPE